ncbi:MAG: hypothetical protein Satyrvirus37_6 [Satyrvirus sp.]|uniref:Ankyrin repeat protein n=1 Tax=Satyrvirus sp. TaxID=2487771 RepID=A0A3G5AHI4_9VIRU|nr:MAG: hypothetical protein Satyrvirus37_6 [Satyrvirus sp.]
MKYPTYEEPITSIRVTKIVNDIENTNCQEKTPDCRCIYGMSCELAKNSIHPKLSENLYYFMLSNVESFEISDSWDSIVTFVSRDYAYYSNYISSVKKCTIIFDSGSLDQLLRLQNKYGFKCLEIIQKLIEKYPSYVTYLNSKIGWTCLAYAASWMSIHEIEAYLDMGFAPGPEFYRCVGERKYLYFETKLKLIKRAVQANQIFGADCANKDILRECVKFSDNITEVKTLMRSFMYINIQHSHEVFEPAYIKFGFDIIIFLADIGTNFSFDRVCLSIMYSNNKRSFDIHQMINEIKFTEIMFPYREHDVHVLSTSIRFNNCELFDFLLDKGCAINKTCNHTCCADILVELLTIFNCYNEIDFEFITHCVSSIMDKRKIITMNKHYFLQNPAKYRYGNKLYTWMKDKYPNIFQMISAPGPIE